MRVNLQSGTKSITLSNATRSINITLQNTGTPPVGLPAGGSTGQYPRKVSSNDYELEWHTLDKSDVGLPLVDNVSDANKPISTATQNALDTKQPLDSDLTAVAGLSPSNDDLLQRKAGAWTNRTPAQVKTDLSLTKADVSLGNADNTSDINKGISTLQQAALDTKQNTSEKGDPDGYASLDGTGKVPAAQLPSYVDDVLEYANLAAFPGTGTAGIIYVALDTDKVYRWSGSQYTEITPSEVISVFGRTGSISAVSGDYSAAQITNTPSGNIAAITVQNALNELDTEKQPLASDLTTIAAISPSNDDIIQRKAGAWVNRTPAQLKTDLVLVKGDVGLGNVDNTSDANKSISTATQAALDLKAPLASPALTGTPTVPTASAGTNNTQIASTAYVDSAVALVEGSDVDSFNGRIGTVIPVANDYSALVETVTGAKTFNAGSFLDKGNQVFDVRAYGAVLDGVTDDAAALQATHDAMPSTGGKMYIPPGYTALLNSKLQISRSNFELDFTGATIKAGASAANLSLATGQPGLVHVRTTGSTQDNVYIHGGTIDANNIAEVNNFSIFGAGSDDTIWSLTNVWIEDVTFLNKGNSTLTSSMVMIATGNVGSANPRVGRIRGLTFKNCTFRYGDKVMLYYGGDYMEDLTVDSCWFGDNVEHTIQQQTYTSNTIATGNVRTSKRIKIKNCKFIDTMTSTATGTRADFHDSTKTGGYDLELTNNYHDALARTTSISTVGDRYAYNIHNWQRVDITHNHFYYMRAVVSIGGSIAASDWAYAGNQEVFFTDNHIHNAITTFDLDATYNIKMHRNIFKDCAFGPFGAYGPHQNLEFHDNQLIDCNTFIEDAALLDGLGLTVAGINEYQKAGIEIGGDNRMSFKGNKIIDTRALQDPGASVATFSEVTGGALGARTYYVRISYENISGETLASTEQSTAVSANKLLKIVPGAPAGLDTTFHTAQGIRKVNIYINSSSGSNTCQVSLDYPGYLGQYSTGGWTEPTTGLFAQTVTSVDTTNNILTVSGTTVPVSGTKIRLTSTGTLPAGLVTSTTYYVIYVSSTTFKLATTLLDALYNIPIDITDAGSGTHSVVGAPLPGTNTTHALTKYGFFRLNGATNYAAGKNIYKDNEFFGIGTSYYFGTEYDIGTAPFVGNLMNDVALPQNVSVGLESGADFVTYLQAPLQPTCTPSASGGTLATGTYYYVITALNAVGETVGSTEKSVSVTGPTGSVAVSWTAVTGATSYHVWRSTGTDQSHRQSGYFFSASSPFTDTGGALTPGTIPTVPTAIVNRINSTGASYLTAGGLTVPTLTATSQVNHGADPASTNGARALYSSGLIFDSRVASSTNGIVFRTDTTNGQSERMKIAATGWIYIDSNLNGAALQSNNGIALGWNKSAGDGESVLVYNTSAGALPRLALSSYTGSVYTEEATLKGGKLGIGQTAPTAVLHLKAGTTAANTAPLKLTSGSLMTTAEAGAIEFLTDKYYATITTGAARKELILGDNAITDGVNLVLGTSTGTKIGTATTQKLAFYNSTPIVKPTALTSANAGTLNTGDATSDTIIGNMRTRINELESKLQSLGLLS